MKIPQDHKRFRKINEIYLIKFVLRLIKFFDLRESFLLESQWLQT